MDFREYLDVADTLCQGETEGAWRSAVSRAYYAAFHVGCDLLQSLGFTIPRADQAHAFVWRRLGNSGQPDVERAGARINALRKERNHADYDGDRVVSVHIALDVVGIAESVVRLLDEATQEPVRSRIMEAIKVYERDVLKEVTWQAT
jgi:uncharacterized protein (UPF0332 family)